jgi:hypothetical protein
MRRMALMVASVCCLMFVAASVRAGQIENPQYKEWAKYKPGTSMTMATTSDAGGQTSNMETKTTLKEVTDDKVVLDISMSMDAGGTKMNMPAQTSEIKKMIDAPAADATAAAAANAPKPDTKTSDESVTVGAGTFKAKVTEATMDAGGSKTTSKTWMSDDVPGGMVKMEATTDGPMKSTTKMELKAFDKK